MTRGLTLLALIDALAGVFRGGGRQADHGVLGSARTAAPPTWRFCTGKEPIIAALGYPLPITIIRRDARRSPARYSTGPHGSYGPARGAALLGGGRAAL